MIRVAVALIVLGLASLMPTFSSASDEFARPPGDGAITFASLGRDEAAGAFLWILTTQQAGRDAYGRAGYPHLELWLETVFLHNPQLTDAYTLGTVLLLTDRDRAATMDRLLAQAETRYPTNYEYPMLRGMSAYFGQLDAVAAAAHFERAATMRQAPLYLKQFAERLRRDTTDCGVMVVNMRAMADISEQRISMTGQIEGVYLRCLERELKQAATSFKLNKNRIGTIADLIDAGYLKAVPPAPPGKCWEIQGNGVVLIPCGEVSP